MIKKPDYKRNNRHHREIFKLPANGPLPSVSWLEFSDSIFLLILTFSEKTMPRENKVRKQLSEEEKTEIEEAFDLFDTDQDKLLDRDEFKGMEHNHKFYAKKKIRNEFCTLESRPEGPGTQHHKGKIYKNFQAAR